MNEKLIKDFINAVKAEKKKPSPYDTSAKVVRVDGGIAWVHIAGGIDETPVKMTTSAKVGDEVQVRVSGGRAFIIGNATAPPTDDTQAIKATRKAENAQEKASNAIDYAEIAKTASDEARTYASEAKETTDIIKHYAEEAGETVEQILDDALSAGQSAQEAKESAEDALESAGVAYNSASLAINQLGVIEDIVGVLDLVRKNGTYERTTDPEPIPSKWYFVRTGSGTSADPYVYEVQTSITFEYVLTADTDIIQGKPYYTRSGAGTEQDPYVYTEVENPVVADIGTYYEYTNWNYFQLTGVDSAIQNYVSDHIAYAGGVLSLQNGATRVQLSTDANDGLTFYNNGQQVAKYGSDAVIGDPNGVHIVLTADYNNTGKPRLSFYMGSRPDTEVAYISNNMLYITQTVVLQEMKVGDSTYGQWSWKVHTTTINGNTKNNLYLKWLG